MKGAIPLSANKWMGEEEGVEKKKVREENRMLQRNRNMQREKEENWNMIEFTQQWDWCGFNLVEVADKQKFTLIKAT